MTTQNENTRRILEMLAQGKLTIDDAERLLKAVADAETGPAASSTPDAPADSEPKRKRWLRINIHKPANEHRPHAKDVTIRVPLGVVRGGMRLGALVATFAGEKAAQRMKDRGLDLDLSAINGDLSKMNGPEFDAFLNSLHDIDIEDGKSRVRITSE